MTTSDKEKRILIVCQHFWPESFRVNDITEYFLSKGYTVDILCGRPNYPSGKLAKGYTLFNKSREDYKGATIYRSFEIPRGNNSNLRIFINYISFPMSSIFRVPRLLFKNYDQIFIYQLSPVMMSIAGIIIGKLKHIPITMYVLDLWPENLYSVLNIKNRLLRKIAEKNSHWYYKKANKLVALTNNMRQQLIKVTGKDEKKVIVLPQACEKIYEEKIVDKNLTKRFGKYFNIIFTGNISPAQSFATMIEAAKILKDRGYNNIRWIIVGDGMSSKDIKKKVKEEGLGKIFIFEGQHPINDIPKYTNIASVLVGCLVKSDLLEATVPAKVLSYIAAGKPIVLAMDGEARQLINKSIGCGFAGPTEDYRAMANNIEKIYHLSDSQRDKLGEKAVRYHKKYLDRDKLLNKLVKFIFK